ncbi:universal stress protein [Thalassospiraceae bacterium LMO-SO8]|nr:universal stress protein [Alphaproteobacteria bacterium LMO-S08]WND75877.1 universal stress protein [Thalassospiraceae bacterium LMO-SO8]
MSLKDILVHIDLNAESERRLKSAMSLAQAHGAHLVGVYAVPRPYIPAYAEVQITAEVLEAQRASAEEAASRAEAAFKTATANSGLSVEWRQQEGDEGRVLGFHCRYADLTIVSQPDPAQSLFPGDRDLPDRLILTAGRPVMVLPYGYSGDLAGKRILVAWDEGPLASRAVHDALPLLRAAEKVVVMVANPTKVPGEKRDPGADIAAHLARHGVTVEASHVTSDELDVGNLLLSRAADMSADMMVMGAYGHARWSELILGGVTNVVLSHQTVPVVMSH